MPQKLPYTFVRDKYNFREDCLRIFWNFAENEYLDSFILYFEGDQEYDSLILDYEKYDDDISAILIDGNLKVNNLFCTDVDYSMHLIILGNLTANNIAVGGQDLKVNGDLIVSDFFLGSYNHGTATVLGNVNCPYLLLEDYSFTVHGEVKSSFIGTDSVVLKPKERGFLYLNRDYKSIMDAFPKEIFYLHDVEDEFYGIEHHIVVKILDDKGSLILK